MLSDKNLIDFNSGDLIYVRAKPNSSKSELIWDNENMRFDGFLHSIADNNKANNELVKLFKNQLKLRVEIVSGIKSRNKKVVVL